MIIFYDSNSCQRAKKEVVDAESAFRTFRDSWCQIREKNWLSKECMDSMVKEYHRLLDDWTKKKEVFLHLKNFYYIHAHKYSLN